LKNNHLFNHGPAATRNSKTFTRIARIYANSRGKNSFNQGSEHGSRKRQRPFPRIGADFLSVAAKRFETLFFFKKFVVIREIPVEVPGIS